MQVYYVQYEGLYYPIRESKRKNITKLCNNGFKCRSGLHCKYSHCEEELSYWRGVYTFICFFGMHAHLKVYMKYTYMCKCITLYDIFTVNADRTKLPPYEVCNDCSWEYCVTLFECQCFTGTHSAVNEVVVYKDEVKKDLVEIRCPWNYLSMRKKQYQCNHTLNECRHHPVYTCGFPHTEVEQEIWNTWKGTASANASDRTAVS